MRISASRLSHLIVETEMGLVLGKIKDFELDAASQAVTHYLARGRYRDLLARRELLISAANVVAITAERLIVRDTVIPAELRLVSSRRSSRPRAASSVA